MKTKTIMLILFAAPVLLQALPSSKTFQCVSLVFGAEYLTRSDPLSSALWNATTLPVMAIDYEANIVTAEQRLHKIRASFTYRESNTFSINTQPLDEGRMRFLSLELSFSYFHYLSIISSIDFIAGCTIIPGYRLFGKVIAPGATNISENYTVEIGPLFGFSFSSPDLLEFNIVSGISADIPVFGKITYPDGSEENTIPTGLDIFLQTGVSFKLDIFLFKLSYIFSFEAKGSFDPAVIIPQNINYLSSHSVLLNTGVEF